MWEENRVTSLLHTKYPIIQAGMVWASGWRLASAVSNAGGLGVIGSGSMYPKVLDEHITKFKEHSQKPFAVNLPLNYADVPSHLETIFKHNVKIVITSAGNPSTFTHTFKEKGIKVIHVVSSRKFAIKAETSGCDAVIAEGFEAGGHNGREETTTFVLIPLVKQAVKIPVIAAGGIATGGQMLAAIAMGAEGIQLGSRFVASEEASSNGDFKDMVIKANEGDTVLTLKELAPVRILKNNFCSDILKAYQSHATPEELIKLLGKGRSKKGMFNGDLEQGELLIGQVSALISEIKPAAKILEDIVNEYQTALARICHNR